MANLSVPQNIIDAFLSAARSMASERVPQSIVDECVSTGREGNIEAFYRLIESHPRVLDEIDNTPFAETPLHAAASAGHFSFAVEIARLKSSFLSKLNKKGLTPIHLALQAMDKVDVAFQEQRKEDPEMPQTAASLDPEIPRARLRSVVLRLLKFDNKLACVHGKKGFTPLHYAAQTGNLDILIDFLNSYLTSIFELTNLDENALHIALRYNQLDAYQLLLIWLNQAWHLNGGPELLDLKNAEGKTCFDVAKEKDLSQVDNRQIKRVLKLKAFGHRFPALVKAETRGAMLVVLLLLVTLTFQTMLTPPGGTWQDDYTCPDKNACAHKPSHRAGTAIMGLGPYLALLVFNIFNCFALFGLFLSLVPADNYRMDWIVALSALIVLFVVSVFVTYPGSKETPPKFAYPLLVVFSATVALYLSRQFSWPPCSIAVKRFRASFNR